MLWFYYSPDGKQGPFSVTELKQKAAMGILKRNMVVENSNGDQALANTVNGLEFPAVQSAADRNCPLPQAPPVPENCENENHFKKMDSQVSSNSKFDFLKTFSLRKKTGEWSVFARKLIFSASASENEFKINEQTVRKGIRFLKFFFIIFLSLYWSTFIYLLIRLPGILSQMVEVEIIGLFSAAAIFIFGVLLGFCGHFFLLGTYYLLIEVGIKLPILMMSQVEEIGNILQNGEKESVIPHQNGSGKGRPFPIDSSQERIKMESHERECPIDESAQKIWGERDFFEKITTEKKEFFQNSSVISYPQDSRFPSPPKSDSGMR